MTKKVAKLDIFCRKIRTMGMDRVKQMEVFIQVMESGNFTRAAKALGLPRSTVSTIIQGLEDRLGTQLLRRTTRQMVATDEGERFLGSARELVDAMHEADTMFQQDQGQLHGRLRIDMPSRIGRRIVIPALPTLLDAHPDLVVEISTSDSMVNLIAEGLDCVIRVGNLQDSDIICKKLGDIEMITCGSPAYFERYGFPKVPEALSEHVMVNYGQSLPTRPMSVVQKNISSFAETSMTSNVTVNNAEAYIAAARAGLGLIQIPAFDVRDLLVSGELLSILPNLHPPPMQLSLLHARRRNVPARISTFQEWVSKLLRDHGVFAKNNQP